MKFAHIGDTHIGASNFKLEERKLDFYRAFENAIDNCIKERVDLVIQTGDLFDVGRPSVRDIIFALENLARLKEARIPFVTVPGSHDVYMNETPISILERLNLLINIGSERYFKQEEDCVVHKGEILGNYFIAGMPGYRSNVKKRYESLKINMPAGKFSIFVFHHITTNVTGTELFSDIPVSLLPPGFNYYAGGHWHGKHEGMLDESPILYAGSIEHTDSAEMEKNPDKGMYIVDVIDRRPKYRWMPFVTRNIMTKIVEFRELSPSEAMTKIIAEIPRVESGSILLLKLKGNLSIGLRGEINRQRIEAIAKERGFLHCKIFLGDVTDQNGIEYQDTKDKTLEEIESEYLKKKGYEDHVVALAKNFIKLIGLPQTPSELETNSQRCVEMIDQTLGG